MSPEAFRKLLQQHDWFYSYSDDHGVWKRGEAQSQTIERVIATTTDIEIKKIYNEFHEKYYNNSQFVTNDRPYEAPFNV